MGKYISDLPLNTGLTGAELVEIQSGTGTGSSQRVSALNIAKLAPLPLAVNVAYQPLALSAPVANNPTTAITGGTLLAGTYFYKITALNANGETVGSNEVSIVSANLIPPTVNTPTTSTTGGTLAAGTYYYKVTAIGTNGETIGSNEVSITTTGTTSSNTLTWAAITGAVSYKVYRGIATGAESVMYALGNVITFTDMGAAGVTAAPPSVNTATTNTNTNTVTWGAVTGASSYKVYQGEVAGNEDEYWATASLTYTDTGAAGTVGNVPTINTATDGNINAFNVQLALQQVDTALSSILTNAENYTNTKIAALTSTNIPEGTNQYFTEYRNARSVVTALTNNSGVVNIDLSKGSFFTLLLAANVTSITFSNMPAAGLGQTIAIRIQQNATGGFTVALPASFHPTTGSATAVGTAVNTYTLLMITSFDQGTRWEYSMQPMAN